LGGVGRLARKFCLSGVLVQFEVVTEESQCVFSSC
jgi:hypothetical protein